MIQTPFPVTYIIASANVMGRLILSYIVIVVDLKSLTFLPKSRVFTHPSRASQRSRRYPPSEVVGNDVLVYIDIFNMNTFFDENITDGAEDMRVLKKMIAYLVNSQEDIQRLQQKSCKCEKTKCAT